jgi:hypothetical protein
MTIAAITATFAACLLALLIGFQLALAGGLPLGHAAWGGQYRVLPPRLRLGSLAAAVVLGVALWVVLARADLVAPGSAALAVRFATWLFAGYLLLNTLGNLASKNPLERNIMTPVALLLAVAFFVVAQAPY